MTWRDPNNWVSYLSLVEDRELEDRAEQLNRECEEKGHEVVGCCIRCGEVLGDEE